MTEKNRPPLPAGQMTGLRVAGWHVVHDDKPFVSRVSPDEPGFKANSSAESSNEAKLHTELFIAPKRCSENETAAQLSFRKVIGSKEESIQPYTLHNETDTHTASIQPLTTVQRE